MFDKKWFHKIIFVFESKNNTISDNRKNDLKITNQLIPKALQKSFTENHFTCPETQMI